MWNGIVLSNGCIFYSIQLQELSKALKEISEIETILNNCEYEKSAFQENLKEVDLQPYFGNIKKSDFIDSFF